MLFFASDFHLRAPYLTDYKAHEARIVRWLDSIKDVATEIYLLGDVFDYWFEYRSVVPRGNVRFLGKLAEIVDRGVKVHVFTGNHDVWMFDYLQSEIGVTVHTETYEFEADGKHFYVGHGDRTGDDKLYAFMMWCFRNHLLQWCYKWLHPDLSCIIADTWSATSRKGNDKRSDYLMNIAPEDERQVRFARKMLDAGTQVDYFVFGHRHRLLQHNLAPHKSQLFILGDWIRIFSYAVFDGKELRLCHYEA